MTRASGSKAAAPSAPPAKSVETVETVAIRFAGDSGDGMQLTGNQFTSASALAGNDLATFPDFPAEIRAPAGTLAGVSGFQLNFSSRDIHTPGDAPDVLVAMNPAALRANLSDVKPGGTLIINEDEFDARNVAKAGYASNPLEDGSLDGYQMHMVPLTSLTVRAVEEIPKVTAREAKRCKNFFALGLMYWLYDRPMEQTIHWIQAKFKNAPHLEAANLAALKAGYHFGETTEMFVVHYQVQKAALAPGLYRNVMGNTATALGLIAASRLSGLRLFLGSYPITPASDILHELSRHKEFGATTFQAEDEIAAIGSAIGAAFGGSLAVTSTSGPGLCLKSEALNLAIMTELPLLVLDIQRAGPSTGMPTKTEQGDLLQAMFGRNSDSPVPVIAPSTPGDCFYAILEAARVAIKYMTPVILLSDGYLANGAEPWIVPQVEDLEPIPVTFQTDPDSFLPYKRDPETLSRPWAKPGTPGLEHRIGGLEREHETGNVSYIPTNHEYMIHLRNDKVAGIERDLPPLEVLGPDQGPLLVLGWGSTYGSIVAAVETCQARGLPVAAAHLRWLNPFPANLGTVLERYERVLIPEMNLGQLRMLIRARYLVDALGLNKIQGQPFKIQEIVDKIEEVLNASPEGGTP